ncbi:hypothetical protein SPF06_19560 [Sinomonas sp. JGH33]|uniref:Uncharacterized protein n=1 Tax=Sinomonas terricola TaxID=3110330 RepID=A0ABU5TBW3_9MICC|nr:hypothetical protein [Sinomonas sp. JGH33]MEA5456926.1 hypothetical protein [Sinomonas sp. JGH33]
MTFVEETRSVLTVDTREPVTAPVLVNYHMNGGYDWMEEVTKRGWDTPGMWGAEGWDLGQWPYIIVATRTLDTDDSGPLYACATYTEGDVECRWFRQQPRCWEAISAEAHACWKRREASGPHNLPEHAADLPDDLRRPFTGFLD